MVQGGAADISNAALVGIRPEDYPASLHARLRRYFPSSWIACATYDSYTVIARQKDSKHVLELMEECMAGPWNVGAGARPFTSTGKVGERWSDV